MMKKNQKLKAFFLIVLLTILSIMVVLRLPAGKSIILKKEVVYWVACSSWMFEDVKNYRDGFEFFLHNKKVYFTGDKKSSYDYYYFSRKDMAKCYPYQLSVMEKKGYSIEATFEIQKLFFGDYAPSKLISIKMINKKPGWFSCLPDIDNKTGAEK